MAATTGIGWTDGTVNFAIGCTPVGPGCDDCYAAATALRRWGIIFEPGGERRETKSGFLEPIKWQRMREREQYTLTIDGQQEPVPLWVFACSLSDFFDKEWDPTVRTRAWTMIKRCNLLRWQLTTKRVGLVERYLPDDWNGGKGYEHVGIIATMVNQEEIDRDMPKLRALKPLGVKWIGVSIEPQIGLIRLGIWTGVLDWVITGGESKNSPHPPRPYDLQWAAFLVSECAQYETPIFVKQLGDNPVVRGLRYKEERAGFPTWPEEIRVQQMPTIYSPPPGPIGGLL